MERQERQQLRPIIDEVASWVAEARSVLSYRAKINGTGQDAVDSMRRAVIAVQRDGQVDWSIMLFRAGDKRHLRHIARQSHLPPISADEDRVLADLTTQVASAVRDVKAIAGPL